MMTVINSVVVSSGPSSVQVAFAFEGVGVGFDPLSVGVGSVDESVGSTESLGSAESVDESVGSTESVDGSVELVGAGPSVNESVEVAFARGLSGAVAVLLGGLETPKSTETF